MMRYSANARDVHMLRALGRRVIGEAVKAHDRGIKVALAAVLGQYEVKPASQGGMSRLGLAEGGAPGGCVTRLRTYIRFPHKGGHR
eukprot:COSAG02_NODE_32832_length_509_cov_4.558537_1_plen_85_part_10